MLLGVQLHPGLHLLADRREAACERQNEADLGHILRERAVHGKCDDGTCKCSHERFADHWFLLFDFISDNQRRRRRHCVLSFAPCWHSSFLKVRAPKHRDQA
jgi:hypothetical protein